MTGTERNLDVAIAEALGKKAAWYLCEGVSFRMCSPDTPRRKGAV